MICAKQAFRFFIAIFFLNSIGIWLPIAVDWYQYSMITSVTCDSIPYNLTTYFLGLVTVSVYDRIRFLFKMTNYDHKELEFSIWVIVGFVSVVYGIYLMKQIKDRQIEYAIKVGLWGVLISYAIWWIVYFERPKSSAYGALGYENID